MWDNIKYWFLYRFTKRHAYHRVETGLKPGYYDVDTRMLYACMALLESYVDEEMGGPEALQKHINNLEKESLLDTPVRYAAHRQANQEQNALNIYTWWKEYRPLLEMDPNKEDVEVERKMLMVLMGIRSTLWT